MENKDNKKSVKDPFFKRIFFSMSGYTSPTKSLYKTIKESIDSTNEDLNENEFEASPTEIRIAKRNLKLVCYICIVFLFYGLFKLIDSNNIIDATFALSVSVLIGIVFLRNRYNLWILETHESQTFRTWIQRIKSSPSELIP